MLKRIGLRKLAVTSSALILISLIYFLPNTTKPDIILKPNIKYSVNNNYLSVFLIDKYNYVSKVFIDEKTNDLKKDILKKLEIITIGSSKQDIIPNGFKPIIPADTVVKKIELNNDTITIDFSKELLDINKKNEIKMIEAIIYTITNDVVKKVNILVDGVKLSVLPSTKKILHMPLTRNFGINKKYDISSFKNVTSTTIYYINNINSKTYYTPVTKINNDKREKVKIIIDELRSSLNYESNLNSYLKANAILEDYSVNESAISLSFNDKIFDNIMNKEILEEVKYTISMSIKDNYNVKEVLFLVDDKEILKSVLKTLE